MGISFYCFQAIGYIVDLYRGHGLRAKTIIDFALFQAFFSPTPNWTDLQKCRPSTTDSCSTLETIPPQFNKAGWLIVSGLFKKIFVATLLFENGSLDVFSSPENTLPLVCGEGCSIQLYCDFSGYTDLARGSALLLGFDIPENFRQPYSASNLGDFWQRWHITFSQWLRDYIYIPLGGSKCSPNRISLNLFITFLICGLWHGASWGFIIWGGLHGIGLAMHKRSRDRKRKRGLDPKIEATGWQFWIGWATTFSFIAISRIFFVAPNLEVAVVFLERMCDFSASGLGSKVTLVYAIGLGWIMNFYGTNFFHALCSVTSKRSPILQSFLLIVAFFTLMLIRPWRRGTLPLFPILSMFSSRFPNKFRSTVVPPTGTNIILLDHFNTLGFTLGLSLFFMDDICLFSLSLEQHHTASLKAVGKTMSGWIEQYPTVQRVAKVKNDIAAPVESFTNALKLRFLERRLWNQ